jgi:hypothetical protein
MVTALEPITRKLPRGALARFLRLFQGDLYETAEAVGTTPDQCRAWLRDLKIRDELRKRGCKWPVLYRTVASRVDREELLTKFMFDEKQKMRDRMQAVEILGRMSGDFVERRIVTGADGGPLLTVSMNLGAEMPVAELEDRVRRLRERRVTTKIEDEILG